MKTRQVAERKRDDRLKRQQEIAEYAAGDHKDSNEVKITIFIDQMANICYRENGGNYY